MASQRQAPITSFFGSSKTGKSSIRKIGTPTKKQRRGSNFGKCPLCDRSFPFHNLEQHAASCRGTSSIHEEAGKASSDYLVHHREPIPGLFVFEDFITQQEEAHILAELDGNDKSENFLPWNPSSFNGPHYGKRWGVHCNLRDRKVTAPENPLPLFVRSILLPRLRKIKPMTSIRPNEANAIDYRRRLGHFLIAHVDDRKLSKEPIANLSLAGGCYMTFSNVAPQRNTSTTNDIRVWLPPRCLQVLTGRARYDFSHGIANADLCSDRRVSLTLRESPLTVTLQPLRVPRPVSSVLVDSIEPSQEPIPGLFLYEDFITPEEECRILDELDCPDVAWRTEKHSGLHKEKRWGLDHDLWSSHVRPPKRDLPSSVKIILLPKLARLVPMQGCVPNEVNSIEYIRREGHWLKCHTDDRQKYKEPIANLSLAGACYMTFRNDKRNTTLMERKVLLKPRCLQIMTGKVRYDFVHGIENQDLLSERRVSVTMRQIPY